MGTMGYSGIGKHASYFLVICQSRNPAMKAIGSESVLKNQCRSTYFYLVVYIDDIIFCNLVKDSGNCLTAGCVLTFKETFAHAALSTIASLLSIAVQPYKPFLIGALNALLRGKSLIVLS